MAVVVVMVSWGYILWIPAQWGFIHILRGRSARSDKNTPSATRIMSRGVNIKTKVITVKMGLIKEGNLSRFAFVWFPFSSVHSHICIIWQRKFYSNSLCGRFKQAAQKASSPLKNMRAKHVIWHNLDLFHYYSADKSIHSKPLALWKQ